MLEAILGRLASQQWSEHDVYSVRLALDEAIVNAIKHGNRHDENKQVRIACRLSGRGLWVEIADEGCGFNPDNVPDCTCDENLEVPSGRGLMLMRCFMSRVEFNEQGNCVQMEKHRGEESASVRAGDTERAGEAAAQPKPGHRCTSPNRNHATDIRKPGQPPGR